MTRSHIRVYVHFVWATWDRLPILPADPIGLYAVIRSIVRKRGAEVLALGGMPDHVHLLVALGPTVSLADLMHDVKGATSRWLNERGTDAGEPFRWQGRYGAFSVSPSDRPRVAAYILNQANHHAKGDLDNEAEDLG
jgi:putative transposase